MKTSDSVADISAALVAAQTSMSHAFKNKSNPFFKSKYADLETVLNAIKPELNKNGIAVIQGISRVYESDASIIRVTTRLQHLSGQWFESSADAKLSKEDPQQIGSLVSYMRRYALAAMAGIAQSDDDGSAASGHAAEQVTAQITRPSKQQFEDLKKGLILACAEKLQMDVSKQQDKPAIWDLLQRQSQKIIRKEFPGSLASNKSFSIGDCKELSAALSSGRFLS